MGKGQLSLCLVPTPLSIIDLVIDLGISQVQVTNSY